MRVKQRNWSDAELLLIKDPTLGAKKVSERINARVGTVRNIRKKLGIIPNKSAMMSKSRPYRCTKEIRICIRPECSKEFEVIPSSLKKYCSHACHITVNNPARNSRPKKQRNPNISKYKRYSRKVHGLSQKIYEQNKHIINPKNHPRRLCGVEGGWQLDHITPIKECFEQGLTPEEAANIKNLRMLPWRENLMRQYT